MRRSFAIPLLCLAACTEPAQPGSLALTVAWETVPETDVVWLQARVEHRPDARRPGRILASSEPREYRVADPAPVELRMSDVLNGADRRVVVEARERLDPGDDEAPTFGRVTHYGISEPFSLAPGRRVVVEARMQLSTPTTDRHPPEVELLFDGRRRSRVDRDLLGAATVRTRSVGAVLVKLANDPNFNLNPHSFRLEADGSALRCSTAPDADGVEWQDCTLDGWDLGAGLPHAGDGSYTVFASFVDPFGYGSRVARDSVSLDGTGPTVVRGSLTPALARPGQRVLLSVQLDEPRREGGEPPALHVHPLGDGVPPLGSEPAFQASARDPSTCLWSLAPPDGLDGAAWTFSVEGLEDDLGNAAPGEQAVPDDDGEPLTLLVDGGPPELVDGPDADATWTFGLADAALGDRGDPADLAFDFVMREPHPAGALPPAGPCAGTCPEVLLGLHTLPGVGRLPDADGPDGRWGFSFEHTLDPAAWDAVDRTFVLAVRWADAAGNWQDTPVGGGGEAAVRLDFVRPDALRCQLVPALAGLDDVLTYRITASEPLAEPPTLLLPEGDDPPWEAVADPGEANAWAWTLSVADQGDTPGRDLSLGALLWDERGNRSSGPVCERSAVVDGTRPELPEWSRSVRVGGADDELRDEALVGDGDVLRVELRVAEEGGLAPEHPAVAVSGTRLLPLTPVTAEEDGRCVPDGDAWRCGFELPFSRDDHAWIEGAWPLRAELSDLAGNAVVLDNLLGVETLRVDFTPPRAQCFLEPELDNPDGAPRVTATFTEPVVAESVRVEADLEGTFELVGPPADPFAASPTYVFEHRGPEGGERLPEGEWGFAVAATDRAGNTTSEACLGGGRVDGTAPRLLDPVVRIEPGAPRPAGGEDLLVANGGDRLVVEFGLEEAGGLAAGTPRVVLAAPRTLPLAGACEAGDPGAWACSFDLAVDREDHAEAEGRWPVRVAARDLAGNERVEETLGGDLVGLDFSPPRADCSVNRRAARGGDLLRITIGFDEAIAGDEPALIVDPPELGEGFSLDEERTRADLDAPSFVFGQTLPPAADEGDDLEWRFAVRAADLVGNPAEPLDLCRVEGLRVDGRRIVVGPWGEQPYLEGFVDDAEAPGGERSTGTHAADGGRVRVRLATDEAPAEGSLRLVVGGVQVAEAPSEEATGLALAHGFAWELLIGDEHYEEGLARVVVEVEDDAGNGTRTTLGDLDLDYTGPALTGGAFLQRADRSERARARDADGEPLAGELFARPGQPVDVSFAVDEALGARPTVELARGADVWATRYEPGGWSDGERYVEARVADPADGPAPGEGTRSVYARVADVAGNGSRLLLGRLHVDDTPPAAPAAPGLLRLLREPWGSAERPARAYVALQVCREAGGEGAWDFCPADHEPPFEPLSLVRVWEASAGGASRPTCTDGLLTAWDPTAAGAGGGGGGVTIPLAGDRAAVCVSQTDQAGNDSEPVLVEEVEWVASLGGKVPGDTLSNPHLWQHLRRFDAGVLAQSAEDAWEPAAEELEKLLVADAPGGSRAETMTEVVGEQTWTRRQAVVADRPEARLGHAAAFDRARGRLLVFGGRISLGGRSLADVWEWDGTRWHEQSVLDPENDGSPSARLGAELVYDAARGVSVLFGGYETAADGYGTRRDTWTWTGTSWVDHTVEEPTWEDTPFDRVGHGMVYDSGAGAVLLYGGLRFSTDPPVPRQDTYRWDGASWESLDQWNGPTPRYLHGMAYDPGRDRTVVFGGCSDYPGGRLPTLPALHFSCRSAGHELGDTWEWDGLTWQEAPVDDPEDDGEPLPRHAGRLVWVPALAKTVLFGGMTRRDGDCPQHTTSEDEDWCWFSDQWAWDGRSWARLDPAGGAAWHPLAARAGHSLVLDTRQGRALVFGGYLDDEVELAAGERPLDDLWSWDGATWAEHQAGGVWAEPPARSHHGLSWDPVGGRTLLFGGVLDGEGAPCPAGSEAAVLYGSYCLFHDLWAWDGSSWEELTPPVRGDSPPARTEGATAVDGARGVLVLFGGQYSQWPHRPCDDGASPSTTALRWRGDTWEWDGDEWAEVVPEDDEGDGDPSPRDSATAVWDEVLGEVLLYGGTVDVGGAGDPCPDGRVAGQHGYCNLGDLWSWDGTRWLDRSGPAGGAEGRYGHVMAYDSLRGRTLVYGGDRYLAVGAGDPSAGPAALWAVDWRGAQAPATTWEGLTLRAAASGLGWELDLDPVDDPGDPDDDTDLVGEAVPGVALAAWDVRLGAWRELDRGEDDGAAPASLGWETDDGREARRLLLPSDRRLYLALRPLVGLGNGTGDAQVEVDWVELRVRYRWPAE